MEGTTENFIAPDGGWGWLVVFGYALNNMIVIPILQGFGLLYRELLELDLKLSTVDISTIVTVNSSFGMLLAIFNGPVLKTFGYRKIAILGALLVFIGNFFTSRAKSFLEFIVYFSIIISIGTNFLMASFSLALNTYFDKKRGIATAIAMTATGIGPIVMPQLITYLIQCYGISGTGLILSSLSLHSLFAAILLQPVKRHYGTCPTREGNNILTENRESPDERCSKKRNEFYGDPATGRELLTIGTDAIETDHCDDAQHDGVRKKSLDDVVKPHGNNCWGRLVDIFDLDLLRDPIYVNISLGLSFAFVGEMNFSLMIPFIFGDRDLETHQIATIMSVIAGADILSRFVVPFLCPSVKSRTRLVYAISLVLGVLFRIILLYATSYMAMIYVAVGIGFAKGVRSVYMALVIPNYVPLKKLASATGLQMVINGMLLALFGPLLGLLRDNNKNYDNWIHVINIFALITITMWLVETILRRRKKN